MEIFNILLKFIFRSSHTDSDLHYSSQLLSKYCFIQFSDDDNMTVHIKPACILHVQQFTKYEISELNTLQAD